VRTKLRKSGVSGADLDDLTQSVFSTASRRAASIPRDDEQAKRWLLDMARKQAANFRRLYRHTYETSDMRVVREAKAKPEETEEHYAGCELMRKTVDDLGEEEREILLRHDVFGDSLREIAQRFGMTKSGAHIRLHQARERFIAKYGELGSDKKEHKGFLLPLVAPIVGFFRRSSFFRQAADFLWRPFKLGPALSGPTVAFVLATTAPRAAPVPQAPTPPPPSPPVFVAPDPVASDLPMCLSAAPLVMPADVEIPEASTPDARPPALYSTRETSMHDRILELLVAKNYEEALILLQQYREEYPNGRYERELLQYERDLLRLPSKPLIEMEELDDEGE